LAEWRFRPYKGGRKRGKPQTADFIAALTDHGIAISMDGRGQWCDNVFVERLWRSLKYGEIYLRGCESVSAAREGIARYFVFYNSRRPHRAHDVQTPDMVYFNTLAPATRAARP
jgi:putative transposase